MNKITKIAFGSSFVAVLLLTMLVAVPQAKAESPNILVGRDLSIGSTGQDVVVLQGLMSEMGYLTIPYGVPMGYYGALTRSAVARYQSAFNVMPATGYFDAATKITMHNNFAAHGWLTWLGW